MMVVKDTSSGIAALALYDPHPAVRQAAVEALEELGM